MEKIVLGLMFLFFTLMLCAGIAFAFNKIGEESDYCFELFDSIDECKTAVTQAGIKLIIIGAIGCFACGVLSNFFL